MDIDKLKNVINNFTILEMKVISNGCDGVTDQDKIFNLCKNTIQRNNKWYTSDDLEQDINNNNFFRVVVYTVPNSFQLVFMSINDEIGSETHHKTTQFIRIESGTGTALLNDEKIKLTHNSTLIIPPGIKHNIINTGKDPLKLYSIYTPPEHDRDKITFKK